MLVRKLFIERLHIPTCHESKTATISHTAGKNLIRDVWVSAVEVARAVYSSASTVESFECHNAQPEGDGTIANRQKGLRIPSHVQGQHQASSASRLSATEQESSLNLL